MSTEPKVGKLSIPGHQGTFLWTKGYHKNLNKQRCLATALLGASQTQINSIKEEILDRWPERVPDPLGSVLAQFNDHPETTYEEVVSLIKGTEND